MTRPEQSGTRAHNAQFGHKDLMSSFCRVNVALNVKLHGVVLNGCRGHLRVNVHKE